MNTWDRGFDATGNQVWGAKISLINFVGLILWGLLGKLP